MQYWPADASAMPETLPPLFDFISRMSFMGRSTAKQLYNVTNSGNNVNGDPAWVAHGFFDGFMATGLPSEYFWSLCITWYVCKALCVFSEY